MNAEFAFETAEGWLVEFDRCDIPRAPIRNAEIAVMFAGLARPSWPRVEEALWRQVARRRASSRQRYAEWSERPARIAHGCANCGEPGHNTRTCAMPAPPDAAAARHRARERVRYRRGGEVARVAKREAARKSYATTRSAKGLRDGSCAACGGFNHNTRTCPLPAAAEVAAARRAEGRRLRDRLRRARARGGKP
jgi:hypothetical protein